jgi:hypothetical protein
MSCGRDAFRNLVVSRCRDELEPKFKFDLFVSTLELWNLPKDQVAAEFARLPPSHHPQGGPCTGSNAISGISLSFHTTRRLRSEKKNYACYCKLTC